MSSHWPRLSPSASGCAATLPSVSTVNRGSAHRGCQLAGLKLVGACAGDECWRLVLEVIALTRELALVALMRELALVALTRELALVPLTRVLALVPLTRVLALVSSDARTGAYSVGREDWRW